MSAPEAEDTPLSGRNAVLELLRAQSRRVEEVAILSEGRGPALQDLLGLAGSLVQRIELAFQEIRASRFELLSGEKHTQVPAGIEGLFYRRCSPIT